jgi:hypothetical protein
MFSELQGTSGLRLCIERHRFFQSRGCRLRSTSGTDRQTYSTAVLGRSSAVLSLQKSINLSPTKARGTHVMNTELQEL